ncbi:MAG: metallophosphoesterase family protein [Planctomycetota bacterium]
MPTAVISDIHGNLEALTVVMADIRRRGVDRVICLGDIIGYGPDPLACVDLVRDQCAWSLMGNHDFGVLYEPTNFNPGAQAAAYWTREQFDAEPDLAKRKARYDFLGRLRVRVVETQPDSDLPFLFVHGSPRRPINEYVFPEDPANAPDKLEQIFERVPHRVACGHTHVPGVFTEEPDFYPPHELTDAAFDLAADPALAHGSRDGVASKVILNVGSVGQPRDADPRASYAIFHPAHAEFVRLEYDMKPTADKIRAIPELSDWLGERLFTGR